MISFPVIVKFNSDGSKLWVKKLTRNVPPGTIPVFSNLLCQATKSGGFILAFSGYNDSVHDLSHLSFVTPFISIVKMDKNGYIVNSKK